MPWDRPIRRKIDAPTLQVFAANVEKLRPDLDKEVYTHLMGSISWLTYYHAAKLRRSGVPNSAVAMRNMLAAVNGKSAFDIIMMAEDLSEKETAIFAEYRVALSSGKL